MSTSKSHSPPPYRKADLIVRGVKKPSPLGTATFIGLRSLDPFLQYHLLAANGLGTALLTHLGIATAPLGPSTAAAAATLSSSSTGWRLLDDQISAIAQRLSLERALLLAMAIGSTAKHSFWLTVVAEEEWPVRNAVLVSIYNTLCNSVNALLLLAAATSAALSTRPCTVPVGSGQRVVSAPVALGALLFVVGNLLEAGSEWQRKRFKACPENKGKLCREGLWAWARHINYGGYTMWRAGYALAGGGWVAGGIMATLQAFAFTRTGMVSLDHYMSRKYKDQWGRYKEDVKWRLLPGVF